MTGNSLPLAGIKVLDFGHTVMGPSCTMILADLGADVLKLEPAPHGDPTRHLRGFGTGYFGYFNRNKRSIAINLKTPEGQKIAHDLVKQSDVLVENFAPGTMARLGIDPDTALKLNPRLIYASLKGFLDGPYKNRLALDEVVQMMSGLAYMTGPTGRPLRAGTSVIDITGGMFAVIAIMCALRQRDETGKGRVVESALFETAVFLMGQHLCYAAQSKDPIPPMPERVSAWAIYETFPLKDSRQIFIGITTDSHWQRFCTHVGWKELLENPAYATNNQRIQARATLIPIFKELMSTLSLEEAQLVAEEARIPFAPIVKAEDLFTDPHLKATGGLMPTRLPNGIETMLPRLPINLAGTELSIRRDPPQVGADTRQVLSQLGITDTDIDALVANGAVTAGKPETV